jgi:broad specificity phosphatase PhoE
VAPHSPLEAGSAIAVGPVSAYQRDVVLVRHGETEWSRTGRHTGRTDIALTDRGRAQATALASLLPRDAPLILTSPRKRARDTAALAGFDATVDDDLVEIDYGRYEGLSTAQIRTKSPQWTVWTGELPGGESLDHAGARADRVIDRVRDTGEVAILFSHGHFLRILAARWLDLPPEMGARLILDTATVSILGHEHGTRALRQWNVTP